MADTAVISAEEAVDKPLIRRKQPIGRSDGGVASDVSFAGLGIRIDEPSALQGIRRAQSARELVTGETEARCPVPNLINDAGVRQEFRWSKQEAA